MKDSDEVRRIRDVYAYLEGSEHQQAKWDRTNPGRVLMQAERRALMQTVLADHGRLPGADTRLIDVGCGRGAELVFMRELGARESNLWGIDLLEHRVEQARGVLPRAHLLTGSAERIDAPSGSFDLVLLFTVMSSIRDESMRQGVAREVVRVLKPPSAGSPGGAILWYDMRLPNPWNRHNLPLAYRDIAALFPAFKLELRSTTLLPPLARRLGRSSRLLYSTLSSIPFLRSHWCGLLLPAG